MKVLKKIGKTIFVILLAVVFVASVASIVSSIAQREQGYSGAFGYMFEVVISDSMQGTIDYGDIVIGKIIDADTKIEVGDIISFKTIKNNQYIIDTHRVSDIWEEGSFGTVYQTWGDNREVCPTPDGGFRTRDDIVAVYKTKLSGVGNAVIMLKSFPGFLALAIPIGIFILYELFVLINTFMKNKKEEMLKETQDAKDAIIREYLAKQQAELQGKAFSAENPPASDDTPDGAGTEQP